VVRKFKTGNPPSVPALVSPSNGALITDYTPTLKWKVVAVPAGTTFDHYQIQVATSNTFSLPLYDQSISGLNTLSFTPPSNLSPNAGFYWRVRSFNTLGHYSSWSSIWSLRTALTPPVLLAPAQGSTPDTLRPQFDWEDIPGATGYTIVISKYANYSSPLINVTVGGSAYAPTNDVYRNLTNYWRVRANGTNTSAWSSRTFMGPNPPGIPALVSPANGALTTDYTPLLDWNNSSLPAGTTFDHYQLQVATNNSFNPFLLDQSITGRSSSTYTFLSDLAPNVRHYWRVRACNSLGQCSAWSARNFRTAIFPPTLTSPISGAILTTVRPAFDWGDVTGASGYTIQISRYSNFSTNIINATVSVSAYTATTNLPRRVVLYWRVRTNGTNGPSAWSEKRTLTIQ
jgi:hypothetical protein